MMTAEELYHFDLKGCLFVRRAFEPDLIRQLNGQLGKLEGAGKDQLPPPCIPNWTPALNEYRIMNIIECGDPADTSKEVVERRLRQRVKAHPELAGPWRARAAVPESRGR